MSRPYYAKTRCSNPYHQISSPASSNIVRPIQTVTWKHISPVQIPQQGRLLRKSHPKEAASKHVRFDLPDSEPSTSIPAQKTPEAASKMQRQRIRKPEKETFCPSPRGRTSYTSSQGRDDNASWTLYPSMRLLPKPTQPTIYIITYAKDLIHSESSTTALLASQVPRRHPPIPHLYTIDARSMRPPPPAMCDRYSGISPAVQEVVMQDPGARRAVRTVVKELLRFGDEQKKRWGGARTEVSMSVCCHAGTHRSVAIAERIAQSVKREVGRLGGDEGVRVVCRHVHRIKGRADPF